MRKLGLLLLAAVGGLSVGASAQDAAPAQADADLAQPDVDLAHADARSAACDANINGSWADARCYQLAYEAYDALLNRRWRRLGELPLAQDEAVRRDLLAAQRAWVAFNERACGFYWNGPPFGTMHRDIVGPSCRIRVIRHRIIEISLIIADLESQ